MAIRKLTRRNRVEWVWDRYEGARRIRKWYRSRGDAEAAEDETKLQTRHTGQSWIELTPEERNDMMLVCSEARQRNVTVRQVWEAYKTGKLDVVPLTRCTLAQAITDTMEWRRGENLRERYMKELEGYLRRFAAGRMEMFVDQIGVAQIQEWFSGRNEALSTRHATIGRIGSLFDVCWKKGHIQENPCLKLPTVKLRQEAPVIFTPDQAESLLRVCRKGWPTMLPYLALGMFVGIRPEEMEKLTWGDLDMKHATVRVDVATSKTSKRRHVPLNDTAKSWLACCKAGAPTDLILPPKVTLRRYRRKMKDAAKIEWHQDILRHTSGSYLLALHKDAGKVAAILGNSAKILGKHYIDLVNDTDCKRFWALTPQAVDGNR